MDKNLIMLEAKKELARREFFYFCHLTAPLFYKPEREFLVRLCNEMQSFYESDENALIINLPPRHGKSRTASMFVEWVLGRNQSEKIMTGSYNETLSTTFSKAVRNAIQEEKADTEKIIYSDIFPNVKIKQGDGAMNLWSLEGGYNNYLATSPSGTATGFGFSHVFFYSIIFFAFFHLKTARTNDLLTPTSKCDTNLSEKTLAKVCAYLQFFLYLAIWLSIVFPRSRSRRRK